MKRAWEIAKSGAKKFGGSVKPYFAQSLKMAWAEAQNTQAVDAAFVKNGVTITVKHITRNQVLLTANNVQTEAHAVYHNVRNVYYYSVSNAPEFAAEIGAKGKNGVNLVDDSAKKFFEIMCAEIKAENDAKIIQKAKENGGHYLLETWNKVTNEGLVEFNKYVDVNGKVSIERVCHN